MKTLTLKAGDVVHIGAGFPARLLADVEVECGTLGTEKDELAAVDEAVSKAQETMWRKYRLIGIYG